MSDNKKLIRLDENDKLVIEDNNAVTTIEGTTSKIEGVYEIDSEDVEKLLTLINDKTILKSYFANVSIGGYICRVPCTRIFTGDEDINKLLSNLSNGYDELEKDYKDLKKNYMTLERNFNNLIKKVKKHNKNSLFNKIKMD